MTNKNDIFVIVAAVTLSHTHMSMGHMHTLTVYRIIIPIIISHASPLIIISVIIM